MKTKTVDIDTMQVDDRYAVIRLIRAARNAADTLLLCKGEVPEHREIMRHNTEAILRDVLAPFKDVK